jgi:hypothetical protein
MHALSAYQHTGECTDQSGMPGEPLSPAYSCHSELSSVQKALKTRSHGSHAIRQGSHAHWQSGIPQLSLSPSLFLAPFFLLTLALPNMRN